MKRSVHNLWREDFALLAVLLVAISSFFVAARTVSALMKHNQTISVTTHAPASAVYNATFSVAAIAIDSTLGSPSGQAVAITSTGGCSGSGSGSAALTMTSGTASCVMHYNQGGSSGYNPAPEVTETTLANQAAVGVTASNGTMVYGGTVPTITAAYNPIITPATPATCSTAATSASPVGPYVSSCSGANDPNYAFTYTAGSVSVTPAAPTIVVTPYSVAYDGNFHTASGTAAGVLGEILNGLDVSGTAHANAGTYHGDPWIFTDSTGNYNNASGTVDDAISQAPATIILGNLNQIYDGVAESAAVATNPAGLATSVTYNGSTVVPTNAGSYAVVATIIDPNYAGSSSGTLVIAPAPAAPVSSSGGGGGVVGGPLSVGYQTPIVATTVATSVGSQSFIANAENTSTLESRPQARVVAAAVSVPSASSIKPLPHLPLGQKNIFDVGLAPAQTASGPGWIFFTLLFAAAMLLGIIGRFVFAWFRRRSLMKKMKYDKHKN